MVDGETLPRKLVLGQRAVNDASLEGLLYARHDSRFLSAKGLVKASVDIPRDRFYTDSDEWLNELWNASDSFEVAEKRLSRADILRLCEESNGNIAPRALIRILFINDYHSSDFQLLSRYCAELRSETRRKDEINAELERAEIPDYP